MGRVKEAMASGIKKIFLSSQGLPLILTFAALAILFVLFRMRGVELDYKISDINGSIEKKLLENKEIKAKKARMLSIKNLRALAQRYELAQPKEKQIIVIP